MTALRRWELLEDRADLAAWAVPVVLIVYLALSSGGYDPLARDEVGVAVWWLVLIGTALNVLPVAGGSRAGRLMLVLAIGFAAWTALAMIWTESEERTAIELARVSTYLAVFTLALAAQGAGRWRHVLNGVTAGLVLVCGLAVLSRMEPSWFPKQIAGRYLTGIHIESRLAYPIDYPSGLGTFAAIGLPLVLAGTASARSIAGRALSGAAIPLVALTLWLSTSSLSVLVAGVGLAAFFLLAPDRLPKLASAAVAAGGSAILFAAVQQRHALDQGLHTPAAQDQGHALLAITLGVCAGVGLVQAAISYWARNAQRPGWLRISRRHAVIATLSVVAVGISIGVAAGAPGKLQGRWEDLKSRGAGVDPAQASRGSQILDFSGSGRYDFWSAAVDANATSPALGIGPGTFEFWWARNGSYVGYVRDAHSLYLETLGELGIVGFALIVALSGGILVIGARRALRAPPELRLGIAAATAGCAAFMAGALVDWMWELGVIPVVFFALAAIACAGGAPAPQSLPGRQPRDPRWRRPGWIAICVLSVAGLTAIAQPLWGAVQLQQSYDAAAERRLGDALDDARAAASAQPYAATPLIQEATLLGRLGEQRAAVNAARGATEREPTDWRTWLALYRTESALGERGKATAARRRAEGLSAHAQVTIH